MFGEGESSLLIDTGASFSVISSASQLILKSNIKLTKSYKCTLTVKGKSFETELFVVDTHVDGILRMDLLSLFDLHIGPESGSIFTWVSDLLYQ